MSAAAAPAAEEIYEYFTSHLSALLSSLPLLVICIVSDLSGFLLTKVQQLLVVLFPQGIRQWTAHGAESLSHVALEGSEILSQYFTNATFVSIMEKLNSTSMVNAEEMKKAIVETLLANYHQAQKNIPESWTHWLQTNLAHVMTADRTLASYLWQTCRGLILLLAVTSIIPGRIHGWTGRALRFPVLGMVYALILVELILYIFIRFAIRTLEWIFANPKHRSMRMAMANAKSYEEWYEIATALDKSQGRSRWTEVVNDDTAYRYSWPFVLELLNDLRSSREKGDVIMALAVLQQCTRKNVGGIMSEDMFSYTNAGEPKVLVEEFVGEVASTLRWVTEVVRVSHREQQQQQGEEEALPVAKVLHPITQKEAEEIETELKSKRDQEENKLYASLMEWATLNILKICDEEAAENGKSLNGRPLDNEGTTNEQTTAAAVMVESMPPTVKLPKSTTFDHSSVLLRAKIKTFLKRARAAYGRTALCLSGGAMMGNYHFGAVRALLETGLLPHIISGTSAGSVIGAMLCTRTDEELIKELTPEVLAPRMSIFASSWAERWRRWWKYGTMFDQEDWARRVRYFTNGHTTFEEAYKKTGRVLCITLSATTKKAPPVLINYITAPNVTIASAVLASAAVPGFIDPMKLQVKDENGVVRNQAKQDEEYRDGSIESDIPTNGLAEMLNCQFFLAAQANPHIVPFFYNSKGDVGRPSRWSSGMRDDSWRGGFLLSALEMYLKNDMRSKMNLLNDLEVAVGFTSTMMAQQTYSGTTTIVPQVCLFDYFKLFADQSVDDMKRYFQGGSVAAYQHVAMLKLHYKIAHALDECLASLEELDESSHDPPRRRRSQMILNKKIHIQGGLHFAKLETPKCDATLPTVDDEYDRGGFDGVDCAFGPGRTSPVDF
eukprot:CCRYP_006955-RA/>CCRYP_006955-RA protein AED:0.07 eAED:0.07 QI:235/0.75/0.6/1/1/1/5/0/892